MVTRGTMPLTKTMVLPGGTSTAAAMGKFEPGVRWRIISCARAARPFQSLGDGSTVTIAFTAVEPPSALPRG